MKIIDFLYSVKSSLETIPVIYSAVSAVEKCARSHLARYQERQRVQREEKVERRWTSLGFSRDILDNHSDCAQFLVSSGITLWMATYQEETIPCDHDGHPMIRVMGEPKRWEEVSDLIHYDETTKEVRSREAPLETWSYLPLQGLVPCSRYEKLLPIAFITQEEVAQVFACASRFYETHDEVDVGVPKDWVLQLYVSPFLRKGILRHPSFDNLMDNNIGKHIALRLIDKEGRVYSFGIHMEERSRQFLFGNQRMTRVLARGLAQVSKVGDDQECRVPEGERWVTSIPLTTERAETIFDMVNSVNRLPFQFLSNNCYRFASYVVELAGYSLHSETTARKVFLSSLPRLHTIPLIGKPLHLAYRLIAAANRETPPSIKSINRFCFSTILTPLGRCLDLFLNLLLVRLGQNRRVPLRRRQLTWHISLRERIRAGVKTLTTPTNVCFPIHFNRWQKAQYSTFVATYPDKRPRLTVVPPQNSQPADS